MSLSIPILTYHGVNVDSDEYFRNDHIALYQDLRLIHSLGKRIIPLSVAMDWLLGEKEDHQVDNAVVINFDDGSWFDYYDLPHPTWGMQRSLMNILMDFREETGEEVHATAFVIASPDARAVLDQTCMIGKGWWTDEWWPAAAESGVLAIENHSWDHMHPTLAKYRKLDPIRDFSHIESQGEADYQILQAKDYIESQVPGHHSKYFVYPCGDYSDYLLNEYLPGRGRKQGLKAALSGGGKPLRKESNPWLCPRYICGYDWRSTGDLVNILRAAG